MVVSMSEHTAAEPGARAAALWRKTAAYLRRIPPMARIVLGAFLLAALFMAARTALITKDASLRLKVQHNLRGAQLSVWVDGDLAYSGRLVGSARKKFGLIPDVQGSLSETLAVSSGSHQLRVRVASDDGSVQENSTRGDLPSNSQHTLLIVARRDDLSLAWPGLETAVAEPVAPMRVPSSSWFSGYAGSLLLAVAGSIVSALTGYAIKEIPRQLGSRPSEAPKA
jgi:hypothetical protein